MDPSRGKLASILIYLSKPRKFGCIAARVTWESYRIPKRLSRSSYAYHGSLLTYVRLFLAVARMDTPTMRVLKIQSQRHIPWTSGLCE